MWKWNLAKVAGLALTAVKYGCIAHCTFEFVADFAVCSGPSMFPTIRQNDVLLTEHISITRQTANIGDIVICRSLSNPHQYVCKRILGLEGDRIDDTEEYPSLSSHTNKHYVPRGHVWLEGDNRDNSTDSRSYGPVPYGLLRSRAVLKIWPPSDIGWISNKT